MGEFGRYIFYSVIGAIIFLIIYSIWFNPTIITSTYDRIKSSVGTNVKSSVEQDPSVQTCLDSLNRKLNVQEEKSPIKVNIYIKEYRKFNNNKEALDYLSSWEFGTGSFIGGNNFPIDFGDWFSIEQEDIIISLVKQEFSAEGQTFSQLYPYLCINGNLITEKRCPQGVMTNIELKKNVPPFRMFDPKDYPTFSYEVHSSSNDLKNYSLILKNDDEEVLESDLGDNPSGGKVEVSISDKDLSNGIETIFTFTTSCGTHKE